jgi:hypothetical protein
MYEERTAPDPTVAPLATLDESSRNAELSRGSRPHQPRVTGLGAPISVLIRLAPYEAPLLRSQLLNGPLSHDGDPSVIEEMLAGLEHDGGTELTVLWPSAYAAIVLRGALADALDGVVSAERDDACLCSLAGSLSAAQAALTTLRAFLEIDNGGLQQVAL